MILPLIAASTSHLPLAESGLTIFVCTAEDLVPLGTLCCCGSQPAPGRQLFSLSIRIHLH